MILTRIGLVAGEGAGWAFISAIILEGDDRENIQDAGSICAARRR
jgi:hypothetical protein